MAYGEMTATIWLVPQLYNLSEYCGCKEKLQGKQLEECASVIATEFYYLKVSELMLFFHRFKSGRYGRFYGSVDPLVITTSLRVFLKERDHAIVEHERCMAQKEAEESRKKAITYADHVAMNGGTGDIRKDPIAALIDKQPKKEGVKANANVSEESLLKIANDIVYNTGKSDKKTVDKMRETFAKYSYQTPEEYIKEHGENL